MKNVKVFLFKVGEEPKVVEMGDDLHSLQNAVGGLIEPVYPFEDEYFIFCNEEGKLIGLEPNRNLGDYDVICGDFLVCKDDGEGGIKDVDEADLDRIKNELPVYDGKRNTDPFMMMMSW